MMRLGLTGVLSGMIVPMVAVQDLLRTERGQSCDFCFYAFVMFQVCFQLGRHAWNIVVYHLSLACMVRVGHRNCFLSSVFFPFHTHHCLSSRVILHLSLIITNRNAPPPLLLFPKTLARWFFQCHIDINFS